MLKKLWLHTRGYRRWICAGVICSASEAIFELLIPLVMADIVDVGIPGGDTGYILLQGGKMVLMALISGFGYAANNIYMGVLPMCYAEQNITSTLVGLFDFSAYVGAGAASWGLGLLITGSDLTAIAAVWMGAAVVSLIALAFCRGQLAQRRATGG